jgi:hypothetical protein
MARTLSPISVSVHRLVLSPLDCRARGRHLAQVAAQLRAMLATFQRSRIYTACAYAGGLPELTAGGHFFGRTNERRLTVSN